MKIYYIVTNIKLNYYFPIFTINTILIYTKFLCLESILKINTRLPKDPILRAKAGVIAVTISSGIQPLQNKVTIGKVLAKAMPGQTGYYYNNLNLFITNLNILIFNWMQGNKKTSINLHEFKGIFSKMIILFNHKWWVQQFLKNNQCLIK